MLVPSGQIRSVHLLVNTSTGYGRNVIRGASRYAHERGNWQISLDLPLSGVMSLMQQTAMRQQQGLPPAIDGIIARITDDEMMRAITSLNLPAVNVSGMTRDASVASVVSDDYSNVQAAFEHLRQLGFISFAYCGKQTLRFARARGETMVDLARKAGCSCAVFDDEADDSIPAMAQWLKGLPTPVGVVASHPLRGLQLLDAARLAEVPCPQRIAVICIDDDDLVCDASAVSLSSVDAAAELVGYESARLLDELMGGKPVPAEVRRICRPRVIERNSTALAAVHDPLVGEALRLIHEHCCGAIGSVKQLLTHLPASRRVLEARFRSATGMTPHDAITHARMQHVRRMLLQTDLPISAIAYRCGYGSASRLAFRFRILEGVSPGDYRRKHLNGRRR